MAETTQSNKTPGAKWPFYGTIDSVNVFDETLNAEQVMELHRRTLPQDEPEYGENVYKTGEYGIYDMGDYDSDITVFPQWLQRAKRNSDRS